MYQYFILPCLYVPFVQLSCYCVKQNVFKINTKIQFLTNHELSSRLLRLPIKNLQQGTLSNTELYIFVDVAF